ncbi:MAG: hypothetical protein WDW36_008620 [Sanguina aurantia]
MADDFERAVLICFNLGLGNVDARLKDQAGSFLVEVKASPDVWRLCTERFSVTQYSEVKFWCLQTLNEVIRARYSSFDEEARTLIKTALMTWLQRDCNTSMALLPPFLRNKIAQTLVRVLQHEFPAQWPTFFQDLLGILPQGEGVVDMFCRILVAIDEDIVSLDIPRSQEESKLSMHVKDSMREGSIEAVAAAWGELVNRYKIQNPGLAASVLMAMQRYISWVDIGLVANEQFVALLNSLLDAESPMLCGAATDCLMEIVAKRMDAVQKLQLVQAMNIVPRVSTWVHGFPKVAVDGATGGGDETLSSKFARLLATLATEVMEALKRVENGIISFSAMGFDVGDEAAVEANGAAALAASLMAALFPPVLAAFMSEDEEVSGPLLPFLVAYVARLKALHKRNQSLPADALQHVRAILEGIARTAQYPSDEGMGSSSSPPAAGGGSSSNGTGSMHSHPDGSVRSAPQYGTHPGQSESASGRTEEQEEVEERRRELFVLFRNIGKIAFPETVAFVGAVLQSVSSKPNSRFQEVEVAVALLYELGEGAPEDSLKAEGGALAQLALALMSQASLPCCRHPLVALTVLECHVRYLKLLQQAPQVLPSVIAAFLDDRGLRHPSEAVSTRSCYLLSRLVKALKQNLRPFLPSLLHSLRPHLELVATTPLLSNIDSNPSGTASGVGVRDAAQGRATAAAAANALVDDRLYIFESVGLLLGQDELDPTEQQAALQSLLEPLLQQVERCLLTMASASSSASSDLSSSQNSAKTVSNSNSSVSRGPSSPSPLQHPNASTSAAAAASAAVAVLAAPGLVLQALECVSRLSKGFRQDLLTRARPALGGMFAKSLEVGVRVLGTWPSSRMLRVRFISLLHRLVECLGLSLLPCLPPALEVLLQTQVDCTDMADVLSLMNQLLQRYKDALQPLLEAILPVLIGRVHVLLDSSWDWSGKSAATPVAAAAAAAAVAESSPGAASASLEECREHGELQRAYYLLLHGIAHNALSHSLLKAPPAAALEAVMAALTRGAATHVDVSVRRTCVQVFERLIADWCGDAGGGGGAAAAAAPAAPPVAETVPGFRRFAMEHLGEQVRGAPCASPSLRASWGCCGGGLDVRDAGTMALLGEASSALKLVYRQCGEAFPAHLAAAVLPSLGVPPQVAAQLVAALQTASVKELRECLREAVVLLQGGAPGRK